MSALPAMSPTVALTWASARRSCGMAPSSRPPWLPVVVTAATRQGDAPGATQRGSHGRAGILGQVFPRTIALAAALGLAIAMLAACASTPPATPAPDPLKRFYEQKLAWGSCADFAT